jgi:hypothetical protein
MEVLRSIEDRERIDELTDTDKRLVVFYRDHPDEPKRVISVWTWEQARVMKTVADAVDVLSLWDDPESVHHNRHGVSFILFPVVKTSLEEPDGIFEALRRWCADYVRRVSWYPPNGYRNTGEFLTLIGSKTIAQLSLLWRAADFYQVEQFFETFGRSYQELLRVKKMTLEEFIGSSRSEYLQQYA